MSMHPDKTSGGHVKGESKRILILTADAGFGHRSAANAIAAALHELDSSAQVHVVNPQEHPRAAKLLRDSQSDYDRIVREAPELYQFGYTATDQTIPSKVMESAVVLMLYEALRDTLKAYDPDTIILTYPLYQAPLNALFRLNGRKAALITVVTDLISVHRIWFHDVVDRLVVPTEEVRELAIKSGVREDKVRVIGIPVNPQVSKDEGAKPDLRARLGWRSDPSPFDPSTSSGQASAQGGSGQALTTILAIGSRRTPRLAEMLRGLNHSGLPIQLVVSAGGDDDLYRELKRTEWHAPAHLYKFVDQMPAFMHASDLIICKAGGLITTESLACGLPLVLIDVIPGQEEGNARFVTDGGAGVIAQSPLDVLEWVCDALQDHGKLLEQYSTNARKLGKPRAAYDIAQMALTAAEVSVWWREEGLPDPNKLTAEELRQMLARFNIAT
jgi:1,2-diacylglycerol 3-beta-galactosyltransferase